MLLQSNLTSYPHTTLANRIYPTTNSIASPQLYNPVQAT